MILRDKIIIQIGNQNDKCKFCEVKTGRDKTRYGFCHCPVVLKEDKGNGAMILSCEGCDEFEEGTFKEK